MLRKVFVVYLLPLYTHCYVVVRIQLRVMTLMTTIQIRSRDTTTTMKTSNFIIVFTLSCYSCVQF